MITSHCIHLFLYLHICKHFEICLLVLFSRLFRIDVFNHQLLYLSFIIVNTVKTPNACGRMMSSMFTASSWRLDVYKKWAINTMSLNMLPHCRQVLNCRPFPGFEGQDDSCAVDMHTITVTTSVVNHLTQISILELQLLQLACDDIPPHFGRPSAILERKYIILGFLNSVLGIQEVNHVEPPPRWALCCGACNSSVYVRFEMYRLKEIGARKVARRFFSLGFRVSVFFLVNAF